MEPVRFASTLVSNKKGITWDLPNEPSLTPWPSSSSCLARVVAVGTGSMRARCPRWRGWAGRPTSLPCAHCRTSTEKKIRCTYCCMFIHPGEVETQSPRCLAVDLVQCSPVRTLRAAAGCWVIRGIKWLCGTRINKGCTVLQITAWNDLTYFMVGFHRPAYTSIMKSSQ